MYGDVTRDRQNYHQKRRPDIQRGFEVEYLCAPGIKNRGSLGSFHLMCPLGKGNDKDGRKKYIGGDFLGDDVRYDRNPTNDFCFNGNSSPLLPGVKFSLASLIAQR